MDIVKHLKDYERSAQDALFEEFLDENLPSLCCREEIKNPEFILEHSKQVNDIVVYTNVSPIVAAKRLACKKP